MTFDSLAERFDALNLPEVTFDQFCATPYYYERLAKFRQLTPGKECFACDHYDGSCNGHSDDCMRVSQ